jgi:hypothetical protein
MKSSNRVFISMDNRHNTIKSSSVITALSAIISALFLSCDYPVYDGNGRFLEEQQSVWQYLKVYSIYQDNWLLKSCENPASCGNLSPNDMFKMINDTLKSPCYRYTDYTDNVLCYIRGSSIPCLEIDTTTPSFDFDFFAVTGSTVYVFISQFTDAAWERFDKMAPNLERFPNIVIDLWDNGGGSLNAVHNMLGELLPSGTEFILYKYRYYDNNKFRGFTKDWEKQRAQTAKPKNKPRLTGKNISVLMNGYSASASEIMASALKDCANAHLIGERSYGKGIGQVVIPRIGRREMRITHMEISGISDRTGDYHRIGIAPDPVPPKDSTEMDAAAKALADFNYPLPDCNEANRMARAYYRNLFCAIKTVEPSYTPPTLEPSQTRKTAETERPIEATLAERALKRIQNRGKTPIGVYVVSEPDPLK